MIVRKLDDGSMLLINQTDHAALSGYFAAHWGNAEFAAPARRESTVRAAALHDCGWSAYETAPRYDRQAKSSPSFFQVPNDASQLQAFGAGIDWLTGLDAYAGLLISRHRTGLWRNRYGVVRTPAMTMRPIDARVEAFAADYERRQELAMAGVDRMEFAVNYRLLQFWDIFSLALCMGEPKDQIFEPVPVAYGQAPEDGVTIRMIPLGGGDIKLDPFPFDQHPLTLGYVYKRLPTHVFASEAEFRLAWFAAAPQVKSFRFL